MKRFLINLIVAVGVCLAFNSCATTVQAQTEDDVYGTSSSVEVSVIMTEGTPAYDANGYIVYYIYDGWYYYPYIYNNRYYFRRYITPINPYYARGWHRPIPRHHFDRPRKPHNIGGHKPNVNHRSNVNHGSHRPNINHGGNRHGSNIQRHPNGGMNRGGGMNNRPSSPQRSSTRMSGRR